MSPSIAVICSRHLVVNWSCRVRRQAFPRSISMSERRADHGSRRLDAHGVLDLLLDGLASGILERELDGDLQVEARRLGCLGDLIARELVACFPSGVGHGDGWGASVHLVDGPAVSTGVQRDR